MKLFAIANQKGGVGKTTTAVNLSTCLAEKGKRVLLIDLDPQANATSAIGYTEGEGNSLYRALIGHARPEDKIKPTRITGLSIIPGDLDLAGAEIGNTDTLAAVNHMKVGEDRTSIADGKPRSG